MSFNATKKSPLRYFLIVFLILVLFLFAFFQYLRNSRIDALKGNISELIKLQEDYSKIDSCAYILYQAENNSRLYAVTADKSYIKLFSTQIQQVSTYLTDLNERIKRKDAKQDFSGLVKQKQLQTESYLKLRKLTDSLVVGLLKLGLLERKEEPKLYLPVIKKPAQKIVKQDTIKHQAAPKKKFFGRIADAISGKNGKDSSVTIIKTETNQLAAPDYSSEIRSYNDKQLKGIRNYYKNLYDKSNKLRDDEKAILLINDKLIAEIISVLKSYKTAEINYVNRSKSLVADELHGELKQLDGIAIINGILLISLIVIVLYNIFKLYDHEKVLISLSKRAAQESHSKSRFLANMSHEIRTPLNSIVGFSEQLGNGKLNEEQIEQVTAIRSSSEMLLEVVNEILDFSKFEVGKINFEHVPFLPEEEIVEVFNSMNVLATNKNIFLKNNMSLDKGLFLTGDRFRLKQVIMNLLTNAIKFTSNGQVTLKAQLVAEGKKQAILKVQVEDTGIGMTKDDLLFIFDEFEQVYSASRTGQQGTGLGLAICKKIVELQGGKIGVSSVVGKGSIFSFEIPYEVAEKAVKVQTNDKEVLETEKLAGKRILLVDDNKMNVLLAQTILKKWKMVYDCAYDGKEAFELFKKNQYDLILTDIQMPIMGGVELTHEIRYNSDVAKSRIPILGITAHVMQENRDAYLKAGMNDLVLKPFLEKELIDQITKYI